MDAWNPWHGCHKLSAGCTNCYVYRRDSSVGKDASIVRKTKSFHEPIRRKRNGEYVIPSRDLFTCMTSDFFLEDADPWRGEIWEMIRQRPDIRFHIITKRILRAADCLPADWGDGYPNVAIGCTVENQQTANQRLPVFCQLPIAYKFIICSPLLGPIWLERHLSPQIKEVVVSGESGPHARPCNYDWVLDLRDQCAAQHIPFHFQATGANFIKNGHPYRIPRRYQHEQARKAGIDLP